MKKQMMAVLAFSAMMTLTMPFASFAAGRSCQTAFPLEAPALPMETMLFP